MANSTAEFDCAGLDFRQTFGFGYGVDFGAFGDEQLHRFEVAIARRVHEWGQG